MRTIPRTASRTQSTEPSNARRSALLRVPVDTRRAALDACSLGLVRSLEHQLAMRSHALAFRTIELHRHARTAVAFRRDSYVCSFGSDEGFGEDAVYLEWLRERIAKYPAGHVHVWHGNMIVGQIEMLVRSVAPEQGYINLFYLVAEARGRGLGDVLHAYAVDFMKDHGASRIYLSVSARNTRAVAYYRKHGWQDQGSEGTDGSVRTMELRLM